MPLDQEFLNYFAKQNRTTNESNTGNKGDVSQHTVKQKVGGAEGKWEGRKKCIAYKGKQIERGFQGVEKAVKMGKHFYFLMFQWYLYILSLSQPQY